MKALLSVVGVAAGALVLTFLGLSSSLRDSDARLASEREALAQARRQAAADAAWRREERDREAKERAAAEEAGRARIGALERDVAEGRKALDAARERASAAEEALRRTEKRASDAERVRDTIQAELLAANDRLEKAYRDVAALEKQLDDARTVEKPKAGGATPEEAPKIDGVVLGVSDKANLVLISAGEKEGVKPGYKFVVYRGTEYVSKLVVDKVEEGWSSCKELTDSRKEKIQQGDNVSTRVFE